MTWYTVVSSFPRTLIKPVGSEKQRDGIEWRIVIKDSVPFITEDLGEARLLRRKYMDKMGSESIKYLIIELKQADTYL